MTSSLLNFFKDSIMACREPPTSALRISFNSLTRPSFIWLDKSSRDIIFIGFNSLSRSWALRFAASSLAFFSSLKAKNCSPASGSPDRPKTSTGLEGGASCTGFPYSLNIARTLAQYGPAIITSWTRRVPFSTKRVATGPRPSVTLASRTTPLAGFSGSDFNSSISASNKIISKSSSIP